MNRLVTDILNNEAHKGGVKAKRLQVQLNKEVEIDPFDMYK